MNDAEALHEAKRLARGGQITFSAHADKRLREHGATPRDVVTAIVTAWTARYQTERNNWKLTGGVDRSGDPLVVVVAFVGNLLVVTIF